jgi:hypothetical protein
MIDPHDLRPIDYIWVIIMVLAWIAYAHYALNLNV